MEYRESLVCVEPGVLQIERRLLPQRNPKWALVRPRRVGICGTDYHIFQGKHPFLQYPRVIGHELAVEIVEAPPDSRLTAGMAYVVNPYLACGRCIACRRGRPNCCVSIEVLGVHCDGGMTGLLCVPSENLIAAPGLSLDECAAVEFLAIGAHAVQRAAVVPGDRVLVVGAGPIGLGVALFALRSGGAVSVLESDPQRAEWAETALGVTAIIAGDDVLKSVSDFTGGDGFDVVFDATGNRDAMERGFAFVAYCGRYVLVSVVRDPITFSDPDFHRKEMTLLGSRNALEEDFARVIAAIGDGTVPVSQLITHRTDLAGAVVEIPKWATDKTGLIKAIVEVD